MSNIHANVGTESRSMGSPHRLTYEKFDIEKGPIGSVPAVPKVPAQGS